MESNLRESTYDRIYAVPAEPRSYRQFMVLPLDELEGERLCHLNLLGPGPLSREQRMMSFTFMGILYRAFAKIKRGKRITLQCIY